MSNQRIQEAFGLFGESAKKATVAFQEFEKGYLRAEMREKRQKKLRKANSRRLRYSLMAHSR